MRRQIGMILTISSILILGACKSGGKGDGGEQHAVTQEDAEQSADSEERLSLQDQFIAICEKRSGEESQHFTVDAIRQWFAEQFATFAGCEDIYEFYNTPNFPVPLFLIGKDVTDISVLKYLENVAVFQSVDNPISDWSPLGDLQGLSAVRIHGSELTQIPDVLVGKPLTHLFLGNLPLEDFSSLAQITTLQVLDLFNLGLTAIPSEVSSLSQLSELYVDNNQITDFAALEGLSSLNALTAYSNGLTSVPAEVGDLSELLLLGLSDNPLTDAAAFDALAGNSSIVELHLEATGMTSVPDAIGSMLELVLVFLGNNEGLGASADYDGLANSESILAIIINENGLNEIPAAVATLVNLEGLGIQNNNISSVASIAAITSLEGLNATSNPIADRTLQYEDNCPPGAASPAVATLCANAQPGNAPLD